VIPPGGGSGDCWTVSVGATDSPTTTQTKNIIHFGLRVVSKRAVEIPTG
jgi:hypothetical protein